MNNLYPNPAVQSTLFSQTASVTLANSIVETSVVGAGQGSLTIPANLFTPGRILHLKMVCFHSVSGNPTNQLRVKLGGVTVLDSGAVASHAGTNDILQMDAYFVCRTAGVSGTLAVEGFYATASDGIISMSNPALVTVDTTGTIAVDLTWQWGTASALNTVTVPIVVLSRA